VKGSHYEEEDEAGDTYTLEVRVWGGDQEDEGENAIWDSH